MLPFSYIGTGTYVNPGTVASVNIPLTDKPDWFYVKDITNWGAASTAVPELYSEWYSSMPQGAYLQEGQTSVGAGTVNLYTAAGTSGGFTFIDSSNPPTFATLAASAINHTTWVVSMTNTGDIVVGDIVRIINPVGMLQAGGITAQVTAVSTNSSITLGYIATAVSAGENFIADATAATILKFYPGKFYPADRQIIFISRATQAKVYFARPNDFTPGELVDFNIPVTYGTPWAPLSFATRLPGGPYRVLVTTNTATESSITLNLDTSGIASAFAYPTSALSVGAASPPTCMPAGSGIVPLNGSATVPQSPPGTNLQDAFDNRNQYYMNIGLNVVGAASATMQWFAIKADYGNLSNA